MLNIVIPMAGRGERFIKAGYVLPKPLLPILGKPMIQWVVENVKPKVAHRFTFAVLAEHIRDYQVDHFLQKLCPGCRVVPVKGVTAGAACTVLQAIEGLSSSEPFLIVNSDQWVDFDINQFLKHAQDLQVDGSILSMKATGPQWSYAKCDESGNVTEVAEKKPISDLATVGIYYFKSVGSFVSAANEMMKRDLKVNGEFYVAPVYNELIRARGRVVTWSVGDFGVQMRSLGTPEYYESFLANLGCLDPSATSITKAKCGSVHNESEVS